MRWRVGLTLAVVCTFGCASGGAKFAREMEDTCRKARASDTERIDACWNLAYGARHGYPEYDQAWGNKKTEHVRAALVQICAIERRPLGPNEKPVLSTGCVDLARLELVDRKTAREHLREVCNRNLSQPQTHPNVSRFDFDLRPTENGSASGWSCGLLVRDGDKFPNDPGAVTRDESLDVLLRGCTLESPTFCRELAARSSDPQIAAHARASAIGFGLRECGVGRTEACDLVAAISPNDPGLRAAIAKGKARNEEAQRQADESMARHRERVRERREENAAREAREDTARAQRDQMFLSAHQALIEQAKRPVTVPPRPAAKVPGSTSGPAMPTAAAAPVLAGASPAKSEAQRKEAIERCIASFPPPTVPSRGDGLGVPEGALNAGIGAVDNCKSPSYLGKVCVEDVKSALGSLRGGENLKVWAADADREARRADAVPLAFQQNRPACRANAQHIASLNTWCFDAQQDKKNCRAALVEALGDVRCAAQSSHWADEAQAAADYAKAKDEHATKCKTAP